MSKKGQNKGFESEFESEFESVLGRGIVSEDFKERAIRLLPMAKDFVANREPDDVFEYTTSMNPKDAYILGLIIGRILAY